MRILILANNDVGLYRFRKELIEELFSLGNEVYISLPFGNYVQPFIDMGCTFVETPVDRRGINPMTDFDLFLAYRTMMRETNPDLVITYTIKPNIYGGIAARLTGKPYAVNITGLGSAFEKGGLIRALVVHLYKLALKEAKVIFFENSANRIEMLSFGCCKKEKTVVLNGAGVNTELYAYQPYPDNEVPKFLFVGRVMKEKGIDELLEAMKRLVSEGEKCTLDVVGPCEEDYGQKLKEYQAAGWLEYHGYQEDVKPFIAACDCYVLPSYHEGMANTNLECASSGRPVITSDIPGCKESVIEGVSGYLCEPKNVESLYQAMKKILNVSGEERSSMGLAAREHIQDVFDKSKVVAETVKHLFWKQ